MNLEYFIANRISFSKDKSFTKTIVRIAMLAVALSLAVMIVTTAMISGFKKEITTKIIGFWGHIHITDSNINNNMEQVPILRGESYYQQIKDLEYVDYQDEVRFLGRPIEGKYTTQRTAGGVDHIQAFAITPGIISTRKDFEGILLKGVADDFDWSRMETYLKSGSVLDLKGELTDQLLISKYTADRMQLEVGKRVLVSFFGNNEQIKRRFTVQGIYSTGLEEYDKKFAFVDIRKVQEVLDWGSDQIGGYEVFIDDMDDVNILSQYIYYDILPSNLYAESIQSKLPNIFEWLQLQDINKEVILLLMVIVAIINMVTALLILILDRTHMIGTLKALGASNWTVRKIFMYNAAHIIFFGTLIGNIVGLGICYAQKHFEFIKLDEKNYYLSTAPIDISWGSVLMLNGGTFLITLIFLILPTFLVTKISPIKSLRFQ